jgi:ankyrin repeat protein
MRVLSFMAAMTLTASVAAQQPTVNPKYNDVMTAVVVSDLSAVNELLALGKWPDKPDSLGRPPLLVALKLGYTDIADALLNAGADPERSLVAARGVEDRKMIALLENFPASSSVGASRKRAP